MSAPPASPAAAAPPVTSRDRLSRWLGLYLLAPLLLLLEIPVAIHIAQSPYDGLVIHNLIVQEVVPGSPADRAGIAPGERLLAVDDRPTLTMVDFYLARAGRYDLAPRHYLLQRDGRVRTVTVVPVRPPSARLAWNYSLSVVGLAFLLMGWLILARRNDMVARHFFGLCMLFAFFMMDVPDWPSRTWLTAKEVARDAAVLLLPVIFLRFCLYFPDRVHLTTAARHRHRLLLLPAAVLFAGSLYANFARLDPATSALVALLQLVTGIYFVAFIAAGLVVSARKLLRRNRPVERTKLRLVGLGLIGGVVPFLAGAVVHNLLPGLELPLREWSALSLVLVPVTFGVAILRYGALDLEYVVRHGLVYALLTAGVVVLYLVLVGVLGHILTGYFKTSSYPVALAAVAIIALTLNPARRALHDWVDGTFYPSRRATREAIETLSHALSELIDDEATLTARLLDGLFDLYRPASLHLLTEQDDAFVQRGSRPPSAPPVPELPPDSTLATVLLLAHRPIYVEEIDGLAVDNATDPASAALLATSLCQLVVPLIAGQRLRGLLLLGGKEGGLLYSQTDIANLHHFGVQAAALLELTRLYQERLSRQRLETELSVARRIQQGLLPAAPIVTGDLELAGRMEPSRDVGGDYFDYLRLDRDRIAVAIADVAGHGIPAAMIMMSLRVEFRTAVVADPDPARLCAHLNRIVCGMGEAGRLVCFFVGILDRRDRLLRFCNAGMNPPLLLRRGGGYLDRLRKGGPMLGIDPDHGYARGSIGLEPGDLCLLHTDGLVDQTGPDGEQRFGPDRLERLLRSLADAAAPLPVSLDRIFAALEEFGGDQPSDDRTAILLRIKQ